MVRSKNTAAGQRVANRKIAREPWREAVIAEARKRLGTEHSLTTLRNRFNLLEEAIEFGIESGALEYADDTAPFDVEDGALLLIGPRRAARRAARLLFRSKNAYLDILLDKPEMVETFTFSDGSRA